MLREQTTLGALAARGTLLLSDGYRTKASELGTPGIPILRVAEVHDGRLAPTFGDHVKDMYRPKIGAKLSRPADVVVTTKGTVGRVARIPQGSPEFVYPPQVCFFRALDDGIDARWLYFWFRSLAFKRQAAAVQGQTDMAAYINLVDMKAMRICLPSASEQREIAITVGALADRVDACRRTIEMAEELADAIFESSSL